MCDVVYRLYDRQFLKDRSIIPFGDMPPYVVLILDWDLSFVIDRFVIIRFFNERKIDLKISFFISDNKKCGGNSDGFVIRIIL